MRVVDARIGTLQVNGAGFSLNQAAGIAVTDDGFIKLVDECTQRVPRRLEAPGRTHGDQLASTLQRRCKADGGGTGPDDGDALDLARLSLHCHWMPCPEFGCSIVQVL